MLALDQQEATKVGLGKKNTFGGAPAKSLILATYSLPEIVAKYEQAIATPLVILTLLSTSLSRIFK